MSLKHIILGFIKLEGELSGYDIKQLIDESTANFWYADFSQIYRALSAIEDDNWVIATEDPNSAHNRKVYRLTEAGEQAFSEWLTSSYPVGKTRRPDLARLFFGKYASRQLHRQTFEQRRQQLQGRLAMYQQIHQSILEQDVEDYPDDYQYWLMTVQQGIFITQAMIDWCNDCLQRLDQMDKSE